VTRSGHFIRFRQLAIAAVVALAAAVAVVGPAAADHHPAPQTFADIVRDSQLIVVARIGFGPEGGVVLTVERVLKGAPTERLAYPPTAEAPPFDDWDRAVVAFKDPITIDFRAPTIAWHVADDGTIDPEGFQRFPGLPGTLEAMVVAFGQDLAEPGVAPVATPAAFQEAPRPSPGGDPWPTLMLTLAVAGCVVGGVVALRRRPGRAQ
jgi:hypothetical protein